MITKRLALFLLIAFLFTLFVASGSRVSAQTLVIDEDGRLYVVGGQVLGKESDDKDEGNKEEGKSESSGSSGSSKEGPKEEIRVETRTETERVKTEIRPDRFRQEVRNTSGVKKVRIKDGKLEVRIKPSEVENEVENEQEEASGTARFEAVKVRQTNEIELKPASGSGVEIRRGRVKARANFPLSIGADNELIVTTPAGTKVVTVLPDAAVSNLLSRGIVSQVATAPSTPSATTTVGAPNEEVELTAEGGKLEYKVRGVKDMKFLGLVPVAAPIEARVSAETGVVTSVTQPLFLNIFGFLFR